MNLLHFFLLQNYIPLYENAILFILSLVDEHLDWFHLGLLLIMLYEHTCTTFCVDIYFHFLRIYLGVELLGLRNCFPSIMHHFILSLALYEGPNFYT